MSVGAGKGEGTGELMICWCERRGPQHVLPEPRAQEGDEGRVARGASFLSFAPLQRVLTSSQVVKKKAPAKKTPAKKAATTKKAPAKKAAAKKTKAK